MNRKDTLNRLAELIGRPDAEVVVDGIEEIWYSVPTGHAEAVEVDLDEHGTFYLWARRWDRTHGLSHESEHGVFTDVEQAARAVTALLGEFAERDARLEAAFADQPEY